MSVNDGASQCSTGKLHPNLVVGKSKAYGLLFTQMRRKDTPPAKFAYFARRAMSLLAEDTIAELPTKKVSSCFKIKTKIWCYFHPYNFQAHTHIYISCLFL